MAELVHHRAGIDAERDQQGRERVPQLVRRHPPAYRRSAEDYLVEALGADRCRFTWTLAFDLTLLGKLNSPLSAPIIRRMFADTRRHFEQLAAQH